jgi:hypothetical protein
MILSMEKMIPLSKMLVTFSGKWKDNPGSLRSLYGKMAGSAGDETMIDGCWMMI